MLRRWTHHMLDVGLCFHWFENFTFAKTAHCLVMPLKGCHLSYVFWSFDCKLSEGGSTWLHIHAQMYVCVCVHLCPSMCAFLYLRTCMGLYVSRCMCIHVCESTQVDECVCSCVHVYTHASVCVFAQVYVLMCGIACAHIRAYQMLHVHAGEQMCLCVCICCFICFCVCLCMCSHTHMRQTPAHMYSHIYTNIYQHTKFSVMWLILGWPCAVDGALKSKKKMEGVGSLRARCRPTTPWDNQMQSRQWRCIFKQRPSCEMLIFCFSQIPTKKICNSSHGMHTSGSSPSVKKNLYTCGQCVADRSLFSYVSTVTRNTIIQFWKDFMHPDTHTHYKYIHY